MSNQPDYSKRHSPSVDAAMTPESNPNVHNKYASVLIAVLLQAIKDATFKESSVTEKYNATEWLCDEDNIVLQLCLDVANMDHSTILKKVAIEGWNLNL